MTALPPAIPYIDSGQIKALAVTGARRWADLPNVPTMVELGYTDFVADTFQAFMAPAKTPPRHRDPAVGDLRRGAEKA